MDPHDRYILRLAYAGGEGTVQARRDDGRAALVRAISAATAYRALAPEVFDVYDDRCQDLGRRAMAEAYIAGAMGVDFDHVGVIDDPIRRGGEDQSEGVQVIITDPDTGMQWWFIPDLDGHGWLLLGTCPACGAPRVPRHYIANQRDLDSYLEGRRDDPDDGIPMETDGDPAHYATCRYAAARTLTNTPKPGKDNKP